MCVMHVFLCSALESEANRCAAHLTAHVEKLHQPALESPHALRIGCAVVDRHLGTARQRFVGGDGAFHTFQLEHAHAPGRVDARCGVSGVMCLAAAIEAVCHYIADRSRSAETTVANGPVIKFLLGSTQTWFPQSPKSSGQL